MRQPLFPLSVGVPSRALISLKAAAASKFSGLGRSPREIFSSPSLCSFFSASARRRKLICVLVCIVVVFLIGYASSQEWISEGTGFTLIIATILLVVGWYGFNEQQKKIREDNRAIDEENERKAKAEEKYRIYHENYQREERALRKRVLDDLKAVARGDKRRLDPETVEAAKKIMERQGVNNPGMAENYPEIVKPWTTLIDDLSAETLEDAKAIQNRLADLLYPETLEEYLLNLG